MASDVARLRFVLSADAGGIKSGCKEAVGSLGDMKNGAGLAMADLDNKGVDWKGLKKSARGLKFIGREMGGQLKGGVGDLVGIATSGMAFGVGGAVAAAGAAGIGMFQEHQEKLEQERVKADQSFRGARAHGIDASSFRQVQDIAGDDTKFLDDLATGMKALKDAGPNASEALKKFGDDVRNFGHFTGYKEEDEKEKGRQLQLSGEKRLEHASPGLSWFFGNKGKDVDAVQARINKGKKEGDAGYLSDYEKNHYTGNPNAWNKRLREYEGLMQDDQSKLEKQSGLIGKGTSEHQSLRSNKEKLTDRLKEIQDIKRAGGFSDADTGRATDEALDDYRKAQHGGAVGMAGASNYGSVEAYSVVAQAQMGAAGNKDTAADTNAILQQQFPELIQAVKSLNPNWRRADGPT